VSPAGDGDRDRDTVTVTVARLPAELSARAATQFSHTLNGR